ncbi:MAG: transglutaminase family protein [Burkholderiales bacterium]
MLLRVTHQTRYNYSPPVETAQHMTHLKPRDGTSQRLLEHALAITPLPDQLNETRDVYGNARTFFSLQKSHDELVILARSTVQTHEPAPCTNEVGWEQVRERYRYRAGGAWDPAAEFVFPSIHVARHDEFARYARASFKAGAPLIVAATDLMRGIHADMSYDPESTEINTPALEALRQRKGVCQDFAHIMIACLRTLGLPARYVSGYLLTHPPPGQPRLVGADASHAWVSVYLPPAGDRDSDDAGAWCDLDPTNNRHPGEDYVTLAIGRDYSDVTPIRGVIHGGAEHTLDVAVTVEPVSAEPSEPDEITEGRPAAR